VTAAHPRGLSGVPLEELSYRDMLDHARDRATREYLVALLRRLDGNVTQAADHAGLERESLHRLLKRHGVKSEDFKPKP
jgi:two-component system response regulator AtoC